MASVIGASVIGASVNMVPLRLVQGAVDAGDSFERLVSQYLQGRGVPVELVKSLFAVDAGMTVN